MNHNMRVEKPEVVECLANTLGNAVHLYFKAHGHHWNVTGRDFSQFHDFFEEIYTDVYSSFDALAENMRKLGAMAPFRLEEFANLSQMDDMDCGPDAMMMVQDLYVANNIMIMSLDNCFAVATSSNEQGVADFIGGRIDEHKKWRWQLASYLSPTEADMPGKSEAVELLDAGDVPVVEQLMNDHVSMDIADEEYDLTFSYYEERDEALMAAGIIVAEEQDLAKALLEIAEKHGKFNEDRTGIWAGYTPAAENEYKEIGVKCINCVLYEGPGVCKIIAQPIEDDGKCRFAVIPDGVVKVEDEQIVAAASRRAPKKDRIYGSKKNKPGSAAGSKKIVFSARTEGSLRKKVEEHNKNAKPGRKATLPMLKAVYRRGSGAFSSSHRPGMTRDGWAMARVNAFLKLLKSGSPSNPNYKQDNDLLPKAHPKSSRAEASIMQHELLEIALKSADEYGSPEHAIYSMAEYSGLGYEAIPALRGAWLRGVRDGDIPFERAYALATKLYESKDADLLPRKRKG
jgi:starvation-inducible DNA-binding protein